jgi:plastocyanin
MTMSRWTRIARNLSLPGKTAFRLCVLVGIGIGLLPFTSLGAVNQEPVGHLTGSVNYHGPQFPPKRFNLVLHPDPYFCGRISDGRGWRLSPAPRLAPGGRVPGAIVFLQKPGEEHAVFSGDKTMKIQNCVFLPHIEVLQAGEVLTLENWDPVQHQLEIFMTSMKGAKPIFQADLQPHPDNRKSDYLSENPNGQPRPGKPRQFTTDEPGVLFFRCNFHEYMEGWRIVVSQPYYTMTRESGEFSISNIPPGTYHLHVWHPLGIFEQVILVRTDHKSRIDLELSPTRTSAPPEDPSNNDPMAIDLIGDTHIAPTVELQQWKPVPQHKTEE